MLPERASAAALEHARLISQYARPVTRSKYISSHEIRRGTVVQTLSTAWSFRHPPRKEAGSRRPFSYAVSRIETTEKAAPTETLSKLRTTTVVQNCTNCTGPERAFGHLADSSGSLFI